MSVSAISFERPEPNEYQASEKSIHPHKCVPLSWRILSIHTIFFERRDWCYVATEARVSVSISKLFLADWMFNPLALWQTVAVLFNIVHKAR
jgi:hypothetical protein